MPAPTINILVFEDNPADVIFLHEALVQDALNTFALLVVERLSDGLPLLATNAYDAVLLDLGLPDSRGLATFERVQHVAPDVPIVIFSGNADEQAAVLAVRAGAQDYVVKGPAGYAMTGRAIRHAIERQNMRRSLRASERRFATAFHASPAAQAITALDSGQLVDVNDAYCCLTGYARHELIGHTTEELHFWATPADRQAVLQHWQSHGRVHDVELNLRTRAGEILTLLVSLEPLDLNGQPCIISTVLDITDRKRAEEKLAESERFSNATLNGLSAHICVIDAAGRLLFVNQAWREFADANPPVPVNYGLGSNYLAVCDSATGSNTEAREFARGIRMVINGQCETYALEYPCHSPEQQRWFVGRVTRFPDEGPLRVVISHENITDRKQAEADLAQLNAQLEERVAQRTLELAAANERLTELDRLKSKFVSDVTHELRTPITSLFLSLELLERGKPEKHADYLSRALQQGLRMKQLIEDILDVSRLDRDLAALTLAPLDLNDLLDHVVAGQQARAEAAGLTLTFEPAVDLPVARGDLNRLSQVATNLIANAINYTSTGTVCVRSFGAAQRLGFEVRDTGMGIAPEDLPHLFQRFYRGQRASQSSVRGTGLGLSIVKEIVEAHGGTVDVESQVGVGSTFRVWLPAAGTSGVA